MTESKKRKQSKSTKQPYKKAKGEKKKSDTNQTVNVYVNDQGNQPEQMTSTPSFIGSFGGAQPTNIDRSSTPAYVMPNSNLYIPPTPTPYVDYGAQTANNVIGGVFNTLNTMVPLAMMGKWGGIKKVAQAAVQKGAQQAASQVLSAAQQAAQERVKKFSMQLKQQRAANSAVIGGGVLNARANVANAAANVGSQMQQGLMKLKPVQSSNVRPLPQGPFKVNQINEGNFMAGPRDDSRRQELLRVSQLQAHPNELMPGADAEARNLIKMMGNISEDVRPPRQWRPNPKDAQKLEHANKVLENIGSSADIDKKMDKLKARKQQLSYSNNAEQIEDDTNQLEYIVENMVGASPMSENMKNRIRNNYNVDPDQLRNPSNYDLEDSFVVHNVNLRTPSPYPNNKWATLSPENVIVSPTDVILPQTIKKSGAGYIAIPNQSGSAKQLYSADQSEFWTKSKSSSSPIILNPNDSAIKKLEFDSKPQKNINTPQRTPEMRKLLDQLEEKVANGTITEEQYRTAAQQLTATRNTRSDEYDLIRKLHPKGTTNFFRKLYNKWKVNKPANMSDENWARLQELTPLVPEFQRQFGTSSGSAVAKRTRFGRAKKILTGKIDAALQTLQSLAKNKKIQTPVSKSKSNSQVYPMQISAYEDLPG